MTCPVAPGQRNNRERTTKHQQISQTYYGIKDDAKIVLLQLLDKVSPVSPVDV